MSLGSNYGGARFALDRSFSELLVYVVSFDDEKIFLTYIANYCLKSIL